MNKTNYEFKYLDDFHCNYAVAQLKGCNSYQYLDKDGNLSEEFYEAKQYSNNFAVVLKTKNGPFQFRDINGNLSEEFYMALPYFEDFSIVQKYKNGPLQLRNTNGQLSKQTFETYENAFDFKTNYPKEISYYTTSIALKLKSAQSIFKLSSKEIVENIDEIKMFLKEEYQKALNKCTTPEEINKIIASFKSKAEYIRQKSFEEYQNLKSVEAIKNESEHIDLF